MRPAQDSDHRPLVSVSEAATLARLSKSAAYRLAAAGVLPGLVRLPGARMLVRRRVLEAWLAGNEGVGAGESALQDARLAIPTALTTTTADGIGASGGAPQYGEPKTARSRRTVTLSATATAALRVHQQRQLARREALGADYGPFDLVVATSVGTPLLARNVVRSFKAALRRAGLSQQIRFHDLRHAAATLMLAAGVHPKVASERLGHSAVGITLDLYTHAVPGLEADAAARLERALDPAADPIEEEDQLGE
jgi:hypothetical protein